MMLTDETRTSPLPAAIPSEPIYRLSVEQYHAMADARILLMEDRVEMLEGFLVPRGRTSPPRATSINLALKALESMIPDDWFVQTQNPITTADSEPEPACAVIRGSIRDYVRRHPWASEVPLVVEVDDESLRKDRTIKQRIYARAGISVYWIINVLDRQIEVLTNPSDSEDEPLYEQREIIHPNGKVPVVIERNTIGAIPVKKIILS